jgi:hypothetical protein
LKSEFRIKQLLEQIIYCSGSAGQDSRLIHINMPALDNDSIPEDQSQHRNEGNIAVNVHEMQKLRSFISDKSLAILTHSHGE